MRAYELARAIGVTSKELLSKAEELGLFILNPLQSVTEEQAEALRAAFAPAQPGASSLTAAPSPVRASVWTREVKPLREARPKKEERGRRAVSLRGRLGQWATGTASRLVARWRRLPAGARSPVNLMLGAVLAVLAVMLVLLFLVGRTPGHYRDPHTISDEQLIQWGEGFVQKANEVLNRVANKERFTVTITEEELNGFLASFFRPEVRRALSARFTGDVRLELPQGTSGLMVHLREGEVVLMARYEGSRFRPVVSVVGQLELGDGGGVRLRLTGVRAGWLPVPMSWVPAVEELRRQSVSLTEKHIGLERIEVREGRLELAGRYVPSGEGRPSSPRR